MLGICLLCRCYYQNSLSICPECQQLLRRLVNLQQMKQSEFSGLWQRFHCLAEYKPPLDRLLLRAKYHNDLTILKALGMLMAESLRETYYDRKASIIAVPMSQSRYVQRGYNQAAVIAETIARYLRQPYRTDIVRHTGLARVQHKLDRKARQKNMRSAFEVVNPVPSRLCLVDDIYTTGATMQALCRALRAAGCEYIEIWIIAKTL